MLPFQLLLPRFLRFYQSLRTGEGQHIDLAIMTAAGATTDWSYSNASVLKAAADHTTRFVKVEALCTLFSNALTVGFEWLS